MCMSLKKDNRQKQKLHNKYKKNTHNKSNMR